MTTIKVTVAHTFGEPLTIEVPARVRVRLCRHRVGAVCRGNGLPAVYQRLKVICIAEGI